MKLQNQFMGVKLASITYIQHIAFCLTITIIDENEKEDCQEFIYAVYTLWWVHFLMAPSLIVSLFLKTKFPTISIMLEFI